MKNVLPPVFLSLLCLLAFTTSAAAECSPWVLWREGWRAGEPSNDKLGMYEKWGQCVMDLNAIAEGLRKPASSYEYVERVSSSTLGATLKGCTHAYCSSTWECLPESMKPERVQ